ncbi:murein transglycosylase [Fusarium austroafricanum]|uniref:Murein transglycosylase n=1 Tax=Fusarium austroafricanum TaxID=2364996 RepID=A0A8H4K913_9HYPO|nr:murein transglycosylase [Fusarium austroafricanum]
MKNLITYTIAATLAAGATAHHQHQHMHARRHAGSKIEKREPDVITEYVVGATETVYELAGEEIDINAAKAGLDGGSLVIVGESNPTYDAPAAPETAAAKPKKEVGAQFYESKSVSASTAVPKPVYSAPAAAPKPKASKPKAGGSSYSGSATGGNKKFVSGTVDCSEFPSDYGAVALDWLKLGGWSGIQYCPDFSFSSKLIYQIDTAISGDGCKPGAMCSYACPAGQQKTQWPAAQGSNKQSIGGLYCNKDGKLELTRDGYDTLCEGGMGGVSIENDLDEQVVTCRTDYPGTENMVIPAIAQPGSNVDVCNPDQDNYYVWNNAGTSAQYYVNKKGYTVEEACVWDSSKGKDAGNWSPVVLGVGYKGGLTYVSIFQNSPTSTAILDFNIEIKGGNKKCSFINGKWSEGTGCTTTAAKGQKITVRYF